MSERIDHCSSFPQNWESKLNVIPAKAGIQATVHVITSGLPPARE